jgi:hypothetical protein
LPAARRAALHTQRRSPPSEECGGRGVACDHVAVLLNPREPPQHARPARSTPLGFGHAPAHHQVRTPKLNNCTFSFALVSLHLFADSPLLLTHRSLQPQRFKFNPKTCTLVGGGGFHRCLLCEKDFRTAQALGSELQQTVHTVRVSMGSGWAPSATLSGDLLRV